MSTSLLKECPELFWRLTICQLWIITSCQGLPSFCIVLKGKGVTTRRLSFVKWVDTSIQDEAKQRESGQLYPLSDVSYQLNSSTAQV